MAQDIKYIVLKHEIELPQSIVHFVEKEALIVPIDLYDSEFETLIDASARLKNADGIFDFIIQEVLPEDSAIDVAKCLQSLQINTFVIASYRDAINTYPWMVVKDNELIPIDNYNVDPHKLIGIEAPSYFDIVNHEERYYSYDDAFYEYYKNNPEKELVRRFG